MLTLRRMLWTEDMIDAEVWSLLTDLLSVERIGAVDFVTHHDA